MKKFILLLILMPVLSNAQIITTFAGNGSFAYTGDGGQATAAAISVPGGIAFDLAGNKYFSAFSNHSIRKISPTGIITTIAGNGMPGFAGDGGPATAAQFNNPIKVAVDGLGNLFIADELNNRVRKINSSGIITTLAGTGFGGYNGDGIAATAAQLFHPTGVTVDHFGNVYIADDANYRIRKVSTTGIITTVAGNGIPGSIGDGGPATAAEINQSYGVTVDSFGNLYLSDQQNNKVRKVLSTGIMTTFAGTGAPGFSGDGGQATAATLHNPSSVAIDSAGNVYFIDQLNNRVRKITPAGIISTFAGNGTPGYTGDGILATAAEINQSNDIGIDHSWHLFICDNLNYRIRSIGSCTGAIINQPVHDTVFAGGVALYTVSTSAPSPVYQWQEDPGTGFVNLVNVWPYSGVYTDSMTINYVGMSLNTTHYRCVISSGTLCADTSASAILIVRPTTGIIYPTNELATVYPDPAHDHITVQLADKNASADIRIINELGQLILQRSFSNGVFNIDISQYPSGTYLLRIHNGDNIIYKKVIKI